MDFLLQIQVDWIMQSCSKYVSSEWINNRDKVLCSHIQCACFQHVASCLQYEGYKITRSFVHDIITIMLEVYKCEEILKLVLFSPICIVMKYSRYFLMFSVSDFVLQRKMTRKSHTRRVLTPLCTELKVGRHPLFLHDLDGSDNICVRFRISTI